MEPSEVFADRSLIFVAPDGVEIPSRLQLGRPRMVQELSWHCDFEVPGVLSRRHGAGIDGLQALLLTMSLVETLLEAKRSDGWRFLWPDTRDETSDVRTWPQAERSAAKGLIPIRPRRSGRQGENLAAKPVTVGKQLFQRRVLC